MLCTPAQTTLDSAIMSWNFRVDVVAKRIAKQRIRLDEVKHDDFVSFLGGE
jgi:hypothetical protein